MCTLTLLRGRWLGGGDGPAPRWRVVFNRDERRSRPEAVPPALHVHGGVHCLHPVDPEGGGTWIAATEHGLVLALLNGNDPADAGPEDRGRRRSRGAIIPTLAAFPRDDAAAVPLDALDPAAYGPFHLVIADERQVVEVASDGRTLERRPPARADRLIRTSSSVDADAVRAWRTRGFEAAAPASAREQDAFHDRTEPDRPGYGIAMARADAWTVSVTAVDVHADMIAMTYRQRDPLSGCFTARGVARCARPSTPATPASSPPRRG